jgi:hypothetical protein
MELNIVRKVKVGNLVFSIKYSNRALLAFTNWNIKEPESYDALITYFFDLSRTGAKADGKEFNYSFEEFLDIVDGSPESIVNFKKAVGELFEPADDKKKPTVKRSK